MYQKWMFLLNPFVHRNKQPTRSAKQALIIDFSAGIRYLHGPLPLPLPLPLLFHLYFHTCLSLMESDPHKSEFFCRTCSYW